MELYHLAATLQQHEESMIFINKKKYYHFSKRKGKYFNTFDHFIVKSLRKEQNTLHKSTIMCNHPKMNRLLGD